MLKVIFLDVDGPLVHSGYENDETEDIDYKKVDLLRQIVDATGAVIVLSSSWRNYHKPNGEKRRRYIILEKALEEYGLHIYMDLPKVETTTDRDLFDSRTLDELMKEPVCYKLERAVEIRKWIDTYKPESYVILDDENYSWRFLHLEKNWVAPSYHKKDGGLSKRHVKKAIKILNTKKDSI